MWYLQSARHDVWDRFCHRPSVFWFFRNRQLWNRAIGASYFGAVGLLGLRMVRGYRDIGPIIKAPRVAFAVASDDCDGQKWCGRSSQNVKFYIFDEQPGFSCSIKFIEQYIPQNAKTRSKSIFRTSFSWVFPNWWIITFYRIMRYPEASESPHRLELSDLGGHMTLSNFKEAFLISWSQTHARHDVVLYLLEQDIPN